LKIYLYSDKDDFNTLRSVQVIHQLIIIALQPEQNSTSYLARLALLFFCKVLQNQVIIVRFNVISLLETLHLFPINKEENLDEQIHWFAVFAKDSGQLSLKVVTRSLSIMAVNFLLQATSVHNKVNCLRMIAYLYMTDLCFENHYTKMKIKLVTKELKEAIKIKNEKLIKSALKAAGSLLMNCNDYWGKMWPNLAEDLVAELIITQNLEIDEFQSEVMRQINNDAKLSLSLADECKSYLIL